MTMMKKLILAAAATATLATTAFAGLKQSAGSVWISDTQASGSLADARSSANNSEYIGCTTFVSSGSPIMTNCYARNPSGAQRSCTSYDPNFAEVAASIGPATLLNFGVDKPTGLCSHVWTLHYSYTAPMVP